MRNIYSRFITPLFIFLSLSLLAETVYANTTVLITGANRGIGLEFVRQYAQRGYTVIATARKPEKANALKTLQAQYKAQQIIIEKLDVTDFDAIDALAAKYKNLSIDILINNAGITGNPPETQVFGDIDYAVFDKVMHVNALAPLKMTEAFIGQVEASEQKKIITVSSSMGSIKKTFGSGYFYRASKAASNMMMYSLVKDYSLKFKKRGIIIGMVNPGPTDTDMMKTMKERGAKLRSTELATSDMIRNIDNLTIKTSGAFLQYDGSILPW